MPDPESDFRYWSRRAREEEVAAINARGPASARAHQRLSALQTARAVLALLYPGEAPRRRDRPRFAPAAAGAVRAETASW